MATPTTPPTRLYAKIRTMSGAHGVRTLTLFNPERRNAIGPQMINELLYAIDDAHADESVRSLVLTGEGGAFCAGGDFAQMTPSGGEGQVLPPKGDYADLLLAMMRAEKPIVARVNGPAMGGGLGLVAAATFAVADVEATLGTPEIHVGLFPMMIMAVLARVVPRRELVEMMVLGKKMSAERAVSIGLLNRAVGAEFLDAAVSEMTEAIAAKSSVAVRLGLRAFAAQEDLDLDKALPLLRTKLGEVLGTDDAREGLTAFLEKRPAVWTGR